MSHILKQFHFLGLLSIILLITESLSAQDISLYKQFNGRFDFIFVGNTLNPQENHIMLFPQIATSSSAELPLNPGDSIVKAYLYWAGCGPGDFEVTLNTSSLTAERTFGYERYRNGLLNQYFSAFVDVTTLVQNIGEGTYTLSDLDLTSEIGFYFNEGGKTNFAGWTLLLVIENSNLPINQINIYDGMQAVPDEINIVLNDLNVVDKVGAKIGFIAWEGDSNISVNETLKINGNTLSNALNPPNNAFNGTNTFTNSSQLYNMDLDVYDIQDFITVANPTVNISLTSGQDLVMVNAIVTKLNNQLPDATIQIDEVQTICGSREITAKFTVYNINSSDVLPANVPIRIYADDILVASTATTLALPIGGHLSSQITFVLPESVPTSFELTFIVDDAGNGLGIIVELDETNNIDSEFVTIPPLPDFNILSPIISCNRSFGSGQFDFSSYSELVKTNEQQIATFFSNQQDAENNQNQIYNSSNFEANTTPLEIFVRVTNENGCFSITSFILKTRNCPPTVYNYVSANGDGLNDTFFIDGLRNIFLNFEVKIYSRWGILLWTGNQNSADWDGTTTNSTTIGSLVADGTYYYVLTLNDPDYPKPLTGFVYFTR